MNNSFQLDRNRTFVGGLHWQALTGAPSEAKKEARRLAKQLSYDLAVSRTTGARQIGLASSDDGYKPGMLSAAAVVSKTLEVESGERDFLCATELPDGRFLYVAQADGVITPEGDFIGSAEAVRLRMLEDLSIGKTWNMVVAPVMWGVPDSSERSFLDFLPRKGGKPDFKHSWWALSPVRQNVGTLARTAAPMFAIACVIAGGVVGVKHWQQQKAAEEAARLAAMQANEPPPEVPRPWKDRPMAGVAAKACDKGFAAIPTLWPGNWKLDAFTCSAAGGTVVVTWKRGEHAWIKHLLEVMPQASISPDGQSASLSLPLDIAAGEAETLIDEKTRALHIQSAAQQMGINVTLAAPPAPPPMPGAQPGEALPTPWREIAWAIKGSALPPDQVIAVLEGPGFRLGSMTARFHNGIMNWDLEGSQYVLP